MSDRDALILGIAADPLNDLPRLVFADWLDDFGTTDLDRATSEYIRLGCGEGRSAWNVLEWEMKNWQRLLPSVRASLGEWSYSSKTYSAKIVAETHLRGIINANFEFDGRGFLKEAWAFRTPWWWGNITKDQPLAEIDPIPF